MKNLKDKIHFHKTMQSTFFKKISNHSYVKHKRSVTLKVDLILFRGIQLKSIVHYYFNFFSLFEDIFFCDNVNFSLNATTLGVRIELL